MTDESSPTVSAGERLAELSGIQLQFRGWNLLLSEEIQRARAKHGTGRTPQNPDMDEGQKLAILIAEVGEVADAMTYRHRKDIKPELLQVATMALLWYDSL